MSHKKPFPIRETRIAGYELRGWTLDV